MILNHNSILLPILTFEFRLVGWLEFESFFQMNDFTVIEHVLLKCAFFLNLHRDKMELTTCNKVFYQFSFDKLVIYDESLCRAFYFDFILLVFQGGAVLKCMLDCVLLPLPPTPVPTYKVVPKATAVVWH